jgi:hypothetical protein
LWRGYCYTSDQREKIVPAERPAMVLTPFPPATPRDEAFAFTAPVTLSEEPTPAIGMTRAGSLLPENAYSASASLWASEHRTRNNEPKGLHMLQGLDERLRKEKAQAELEEKIMAEFDDTFITQVFNYLSLGYPALARQYDEELSKISRITVEDLARDDEIIMDTLWSTKGDGLGVAGGDGPLAASLAKKRVKATGHIMLDSEERVDKTEDERCPRWRALKEYIYEWARQHPDLDSISPQPWGVRERRGSWGI